MSQEWVAALTGFGLLAVVGFLAGTVMAKFPRGPAVVVGFAAAAYVVLVILAGVWVAACPGCTSYMSYDSSRTLDLAIAVLWGGILTAGVVIFTSLGMGISLFARWLRQRAAS